MKKQIKSIAILSLMFGLVACSKKDGSVSKIETGESEQKNITQIMEREEKKVSILPKEDVINTIKADRAEAAQYEAALVAADDSYTYAVLTKKSGMNVISSNSLSFENAGQNYIVVAIRHKTREISYLYEAGVEDGLKQAGMVSAEGKVYLLLNRKMNYDGWERSVMETFVLNASEMKRVYAEVEGTDLFEYWFSHSAELCTDGTIEISKRKQGIEEYQNYVHKKVFRPVIERNLYLNPDAWEQEYKGDLTEYVSKQNWTEFSGISLDQCAEADILRKVKLCSFMKDSTISASEGAVLLREKIGTVSFLVVKGKNEQHEAGFQNLIFMLYDNEKDSIIAEKALMGDFSDAYLFKKNGAIYAAYYTQTNYTGIPSANGGLFKVSEDGLRKVWPTDEAYFDGKVAELTEDGCFSVSKVEWNRNEDGMILGYETKPEESISVYDLMNEQ